MGKIANCLLLQVSFRPAAPGGQSLVIPLSLEPGRWCLGCLLSEHLVGSPDSACLQGTELLALVELRFVSVAVL